MEKNVLCLGNLEEIQVIMNLAKADKAPGPDGLTAYYYKTLFPILGPYLEKMFVRGLDFLPYRNSESSFLRYYLKKGKTPHNVGVTGQFHS